MADSYGFSTTKDNAMVNALLDTSAQRKFDGLVVFDPDGWMERTYSNQLRLDSYRVKVFNTACFCTSAGYNPFVYAKSGISLTKFAAAFVSGTNGYKTPSGIKFISAETALLTALFAYVSNQAPHHEQNFSTVSEMLKCMCSAGESLPYDNDSFHTNAVDYMFDMLKCNKPQCLAVRRYDEFKNMKGLCPNMVIQSCIKRLEPLSNAVMDAYLLNDELDLDSFGTDEFHKTVIFVHAGKSVNFDFLASLLYTQLIDTLCFEIVNK